MLTTPSVTFSSSVKPAFRIAFGAKSSDVAKRDWKSLGQEFRQEMAPKTKWSAGAIGLLLGTLLGIKVASVADKPILSFFTTTPPANSANERFDK